MSPDGVAATIIEKSFRKMAAHENLRYKVRCGFNLIPGVEFYRYSFVDMPHIVLLAIFTIAPLTKTRVNGLKDLQQQI